MLDLNWNSDQKLDSTFKCKYYPHDEQLTVTMWPF